MLQQTATAPPSGWWRWFLLHVTDDDTAAFCDDNAVEATPPNAADADDDDATTRLTLVARAHRGRESGVGIAHRVTAPTPWETIDAISPRPTRTHAHTQAHTRKDFISPEGAGVITEGWFAPLGIILMGRDGCRFS